MFDLHDDRPYVTDRVCVCVKILRGRHRLQREINIYFFFVRSSIVDYFSHYCIVMHARTAGLVRFEPYVVRNLLAIDGANKKKSTMEKNTFL